MTRGLRYPPRRHRMLVQGETPRPVFGIDLDGTLGRYHEHFLWFIEQYLGMDWKPSAEEYDGSVPLHSYLRISKATYREAKLRYRNSGLKRAMPAFPHATELANGLRRRGAEVVICTTRPFNKVDGQDEDTRVWLRRNRIQNDGVLAGEHKYKILASRYLPGSIVAVVDDLPEMIQQASGRGIEAILARRPHNQKFEWEQGFEDLLYMQAVCHRLLSEWEAKARRGGLE